MIEIYVDADACPVKDEVARVAARHGLDVYFVSNQFMRLPEQGKVHRMVVAEGPDKADDWIAERARPGAIVVTADIPLAARCVKAGAQVTSPAGKPFTDANIGMTLATRNLMQDLREANVVQTYNANFSKQDRSRCLQTLEQLVQSAKRAGH
jgi:uncharacterized protein YaiI (UPF0178 family)